MKDWNTVRHDLPTSPEEEEMKRERDKLKDVVDEAFDADDSSMGKGEFHTKNEYTKENRMPWERDDIVSTVMVKFNRPEAPPGWDGKSIFIVVSTPEGDKHRVIAAQWSGKGLHTIKELNPADYQGKNHKEILADVVIGCKKTMARICDKDKISADMDVRDYNVGVLEGEKPGGKTVEFTRQMHSIGVMWSQMTILENGDLKGPIYHLIREEEGLPDIVMQLDATDRFYLEAGMVALRTLATMTPLAMWANMTTGWMARVDIEDAERDGLPRPSEHPDRVEVLTIQTLHKSQHGRYEMHEIIREREGDDLTPATDFKPLEDKEITPENIGEISGGSIVTTFAEDEKDVTE